MTATDGPGHFKFVPGFVRQNAGKEEIYMLEEESSRKRSRKQQEEEPFSWKKEIISWIQIIVAAVIIALVLNNFIIANSRVPTGSMENTIMSKSRVIGSRLAYLTSDPERGDVVISISRTIPRENLLREACHRASRRDCECGGRKSLYQ